MNSSTRGNESNLISQEIVFAGNKKKATATATKSDYEKSKDEIKWNRNYRAMMARILKDLEQ